MQNLISRTGFLVAFALSFGSFLLPGSTASAAPGQVIIIRHGEKPPQGNELSPRGWMRARALPTFFRTNPAAARFGAPVAIYAAGPGRDGGSIRPRQTVTPLSAELGIPIQDQYEKKDLAPLVHEIMTQPEYTGKTVVICWVRQTLPDLARAFGVQDAPRTWPETLFDRAWLLDFSAGPPVRFHDLPQRLLPGDSPE